MPASWRVCHSTLSDIFFSKLDSLKTSERLVLISKAFATYRSGQLTMGQALNTLWKVVGQNSTAIIVVIEERRVVVTEEQVIEVLNFIVTPTPTLNLPRTVSTMVQSSRAGDLHSMIQNVFWFLCPSGLF